MHSFQYEQTLLCSIARLSGTRVLCDTRSHDEAQGARKRSGVDEDVQQYVKVHKSEFQVTFLLEESRE
jgi:hypothetical protein